MTTVTLKDERNWKERNIIFSFPPFGRRGGGRGNLRRQGEDVNVTRNALGRSRAPLFLRYDLPWKTHTMFLPLLPHCQGAHLRVVIFIDIFSRFRVRFQSWKKEKKKGKLKFFFIFCWGIIFIVLLLRWWWRFTHPRPVFFSLSLLFVVVAPLAFLLSLLLIKWLSAFHLLQPSSLSLFFYLILTKQKMLADHHKIVCHLCVWSVAWFS